MMVRDLKSILQLHVPVIVRLGHRTMSLDDVLSLGPGAIIELTKQAEDPLDLLVNNKQIGCGSAVKVGENFGIRVSAVGNAEERIRALAGMNASSDKKQGGDKE